VSNYVYPESLVNFRSNLVKSGFATVPFFPRGGKKGRFQLHFEVHGQIDPGYLWSQSTYLPEAFFDIRASRFEKIPLPDVETRKK